MLVFLPSVLQLLETEEGTELVVSSLFLVLQEIRKKENLRVHVHGNLLGLETRDKRNRKKKEKKKKKKENEKRMKTKEKKKKKKENKNNSNNNNNKLNEVKEK
jgi:flagellar biosynthesis component FlhA